MLDTHEKIVGVMPYIFGIPSYTIFISFGILTGIFYYWLCVRKNKSDNDEAMLIVAFALIFGFIGAKIPLLFETKDIIRIITGKSIVGALLGGMIGIIFIKRRLKIKKKMGNVIAPSVALGMSIGRLGCFFNGCCYGIIAPFGFDFGDGHLRLPTQLFETIFHLICFAFLHIYKTKVKMEGLLFKVYVLIYFIFRFFLEFIRENPKIWLDMSIYQIICLLGSIYLIFIIIRGVKAWKKTENLCLQKVLDQVY